MGNRIISDPNICGGEPSIKGTRIPVHIILSHLAAMMILAGIFPGEKMRISKPVLNTPRIWHLKKK